MNSINMRWADRRQNLQCKSNKKYTNVQCKNDALCQDILCWTHGGGPFIDWDGLAWNTTSVAPTGGWRESYLRTWNEDYLGLEYLKKVALITAR